MYDIIVNVPRGTVKVYKCLDGGIGRRTGLKILWYLVPCRFDSGSRHHLYRGVEQSGSSSGS